LTELFKVLAVGDLVGSPGRRAVRELLPRIREREGVDLAVVNAENAAGGSGLTPDIVRALLDAGCDCLTTGDHVYKNRAVLEIIDDESRLLRPANIAAGAPGRGWTVLEPEDGPRVAVVNLLGRAFLGTANNPFECIEKVLAEIEGSAEVVLVDFHAEATAEKIAMGRFLDGRAAAVWGTHTHVQTADEEVLPGGTGYITDLGMTGGHDGVIGRRAKEVVEHLRLDIPTRWEIAKGDVRLSGAIFEIDPSAGRCRAARRVQLSRE
jgi:metallophosphoesterase (TIGR00282 family)